MRRQSRSLQVSILFAYFLFLLAGVSFDNMQKIKNGTCIVSACYDEKQMREEWEQKLIWDKEDFPGLPQEGDTVGISYYFYDEKGRLDSVKSYGKYNSRKRKTKKNIPAGIAHIHSTFNNTIVTITDLEGNVVSWASSGKQGVKGSKKSTPFAAGMSAEAAGRDAVAAGMKKVKVEVKGLGSGREAAIRSLQTAGLEIESITDVTPIPHNGCRPPKRRRG